MWEDLNNENKEAIINYGISKGYGSLDAIKNHYQKLQEQMYSAEVGSIYDNAINEFKNGSKLNRNKKSKEYYDNGIRKLKEGIDKVLQNPKYEKFNTPDWKEWLTKLAIRESAGDPTVTNQIGAYGYWQLMPSNRNKSKTDPNGQFEDMLDLMTDNYDYLVKNMSEDDWKKAYSKGYDMYSLLGGAHLGGVKNTLAALRSGKNTKDANGTGVLDYMNKFGDPTKPQSTVPQYNMITPINVPKFDFKKQFSTPSVFNSATQPFTDWSNNMTTQYTNFGNQLNTMLAVNRAISNQAPLVDWQKEADIERMKQQQLTKDVKENNISSSPQQQFFTSYDDDFYSHKADEAYAEQTALLRRIHSHKQNADWTKSPFMDWTKPINAAYGGNLNTLPSFKGGRPLEPVLYGDGGEKEVKEYINQQFPSAKAFGTFLPDYRIYADPNFTRDNTGTGSIEYMNEDQVIYPNGFTYNNPYPDTATLIYDPKTNSKDDIKLDLLHHYRFNDPVYKDLVNIYAKTQNPANILWNSQLGDKFRKLPQKLQSRELWNEMVKEQMSDNEDSEYMVQGIDGSLRGLMASPEQRNNNNYAPLEIYQKENLSTPETINAYQNIQDYLTSERLPNIDVYPNRHSNGGNLYENGGDDTRKFSYDNTVVYNNSQYPTATMTLQDFNGDTKDRTVFPMNGEYYAVGDDNKAHNIMLDYIIPEVTVASPRLNRPLAASINDLSINSNDNTQVNNIQYGRYDAPSKEYNQQLKERALRGAAMNAIWEKENPNATALRNFAEGAVMTLPLWPAAGAAADAIAGTTAGQAITNGLNFATKAIGSNKAWPFIDAGITSYFGAEGMNDLMNGKFTPETAMNLLPFLQMARPVVEESKAGFDFIRNWRPRVPQTKGRYYRIVGTEGDPIRDAIENGVIRGPGANPDAEDALLKAAEETGNRFNIVKAFDYPMFSKDRLWKGTTARVSSKSKPYIIRSKADTGPIVWEESSKDFRHKGHPGIFRPSYYGDVNASPTKYFEYWEPQKFGYVKKDFPYEEPKFQSSLDWSPEGWFGTRVTGNYDDEDIKALNAHLPEYLEIERIAKANNTWLKMPDGSKWEGDPRSWVQMMSKDYNKYTGKSPFKYKPFSHSTGATFDTFDISHFGETDDGFYGRGFYTHPAENIKGKLQGRNSYGDINYLLTTNVQRPFDLRNQNFKYAGLFNWENTNAPKGIFDGYDSVYYGVPGENLVGGSPAELVVPEPNNYKSLLGNNGNFDALNPNIYKVILPLGLLAGTGYYSSKQR